MAAIDNPGKESLPERIRAGEETAFEEFRTRYAASFFYYFRRRGLPEVAAIDLAGNCITDIALKVRDHFDPLHTCFDAWVNLLRQRAAADWWRREKRFPTVELDPEWAAPAQEAETEAVALVAVSDALAGLDPLDRDLLLLRYGRQQPSFGEIAAELSGRHGRELKEPTLRQRHARALTRLKEILRLDPRLAQILEKVEEATGRGSESGGMQ